MDSDYTVFIHVLAPDGSLCTQTDSLLEYEGRPTSDWSIGRLVKGIHQLQLPGEATPGEYTVLLGIYHWETGERLPVWDAEGARLREDIVELASVAVRASADE
jgi:hypothetical protein